MSGLKDLSFKLYPIASVVFLIAFSRADLLDAITLASSTSTSPDVGYFIDGRYYDLERGDLVIIRPNERHHSLIHKECHYERYFFKFPKGCLPAPASGMSSPIAFIESPIAFIVSPIPGRLVRLPVEERSEVLRAVAEIRDLTLNEQA